MRRLASLALLSLLVSCAALAGCGDDAGDDARRLRSETSALAPADGCTAVADCVVKARGQAGCGGPRDYLVFCSKTTDVATLDKKLSELAEADRKINEESKEDGLADTCSVPIAPKAELVSGTCRGN